MGRTRKSRTEPRDAPLEYGSGSGLHFRGKLPGGRPFLSQLTSTLGWKSSPGNVAIPILFGISPSQSRLHAVFTCSGSTLPFRLRSNPTDVPGRTQWVPFRRPLPSGTQYTRHLHTQPNRKLNGFCVSAERRQGQARNLVYSPRPVRPN